MAATNNGDDPGYAELPSALQRKIDNAFESILLHSSASPSKRRKLDHDLAPEPGGFLLNDNPPDETSSLGGFLLDGPQVSGLEHMTTIPLSSIPEALQLLDLQPDDEDVLSVFQNAASGWNDFSPPVSSDQSWALVTLKDWRAVCAALLNPDLDGEDMDMGRGNQAPPSDSEAGVPINELSDSGEEYMYTSSSESGSVALDNSYREGGFVPIRNLRGKASSSTKSRRASKRSVSSDDSGRDNTTHNELTLRQKQECRSAFALFFPDVPDASLDVQRIRVQDIARVTALLKEVISAEEMAEMLDAFSATADRSMGLRDFERMMVSAKLA